MCLTINNGWARLEVLMAVDMRSVIFWELLPCTLVPKNQNFGRSTA